MTGATAGAERALGPGRRVRVAGWPDGRAKTRPWTTLLVMGAVGGLLFLAYLRVSWTVAATADGAAQALQARDMLAGNWLLHGWTVSDVSFYTTELPEYVLVELVRPLGPGVIHVAAALTYTLLVLTVFALARGRAGGREGVLRGLLAAGIMLAPQLGYGAFVLLLSPDHTGTQVPLLLGWLLLDVAAIPGSRWRRWAPPALCVLLAWVQFADRVALLTAVLPLALVSTVRLISLARASRQPPLGISSGAGARLGISYDQLNRDKTDRKVVVSDTKSAGVARSDGKWGQSEGGGGPAGAGWAREAGAGWRRGVEGTERAGDAERAGRARDTHGGGLPGGWRFEAGLAVAAVAAVGLAWVAARGLAAAGGFTAHPLPFTLAPARLLWTHAWLTGWGVLEVYGANFAGVTGLAGLAVAVLHLAGLALAAAGTGLALWSFLRSPRRSGLADSVLAFAVVANLVSYLVSIEPGTVPGTGYDAREIAAVLPLGAVLAGRRLGPRLAKSINANFRGGFFLALAFFLGIAGYASALGYAAAQPAAVSPDTALAGWLAVHGLRDGLGGPSANLLTVDSGGRVTVAPVTVTSGHVRPLVYQGTSAAYDPRRHDPVFLVTGVPAARAGQPGERLPEAAVLATFGPPTRIGRFAGFTVDVWGVNLLTKMRE